MSEDSPDRGRNRREQVGHELLAVIGEARVPGPPAPGLLTARRAATLMIGLFVAAGLSVIAAVVLLAFAVGGEQDRAERAAMLAERRVLAELDRRSAARDAIDAQAELRQDEAVCLIIGDLQDSQGTRSLAEQLDCPQFDTDPALPGPAEPSPGSSGPPTGSSGPQSGRTRPAPHARGGPAAPTPGPAATQTPAPPPPAPAPDPAPAAPAPGPSPSPCTVLLLGRCPVP